MAQEFTIKSQQIEDKINQLLPSQGGFQPGVDFSASTMVIPIVDLTETAEGSSLRSDLQTAISLNSATVFNVNNGTSTIINTTGYWRIIGTASMVVGSSNQECVIKINDGFSTKDVWSTEITTQATQNGTNTPFDLVIYLKAGDSLIVGANLSSRIKGSVRQIADINGNLVNPT